MKKSKFTRLVALLLALIFCFGVGGVTVSADTSSGSGENQSGNSIADNKFYEDPNEMKSYLDASSYSVYQQRWKDKLPGSGSYSVDVTDFNSTNSDASLVINSAACQDYASWPEMSREKAENSVYLPNSGSVSFTVEAPSDGLYYIAIKYYAVAGTVNGIERKLYIDDSIPFSEASYLRFSKLWGYDYPTDEDGDPIFDQDLNGNDLQPEINAVQDWRTYICSDSTGYTNGYFAFFLTEGEHTITLEAAREACIVSEITLVPSDDSTYNAPLYETYINNMVAKYNAVEVPKSTAKIKIQAEKPILVSDTSVYMGNDASSAINSPTSAAAQLFNVIGATSFDTVGQWAAYSFTVSESGFYNIDLRYHQNALQGMYVCRTIRLWSSNRDASAGVVYGLDDGTPLVPFDAAYNARFDYNKDWQSEALNDGTDEFLFYFDAGVEYQIYIEVGLGSLGSLIKRVEESLKTINDAYLDIIKLTGASPDEYRDYHFSTNMPNVIWHFNNEAIALAQVAERFEELCGTTGSHIATLKTISNLLTRMGGKETEIAKNLATLKSYLGTLGTWVNNSKASVMAIDFISVQSPEAKAPKANANFFQTFGYQVKAFFMSFFTDYDNMGVTDEASLGDSALNVWLALGRDQSKIWRSLIDGSYSKLDNAGPVSLKLVVASTLLPSVLAGKGPDVYLGLDSASVINYAIRGAIKDVSYFEDFNTAAFGADGTANTDDDVYHKTAMNTLTLQNKTYGLPLTMNFPMMFYRLDVLAELGVAVPTTWDEVLALLPIFQSNYLEIGVTYVLALDFFLYQNGGSMWLYEDNPDYAGSQIGLGTNEALEAFRFCTSLYTDYGFPVSFDAANRFRTGEMPLVISDYINVYNTLTVFATEIKGLWSFSSIPGVAGDDGRVKNYDSIATVTATVMLHGCKDPDAAWNFMKWQTSADVEAEYGNRMVALIGPSAKYAAANLGAIEKLSWTTKENAAIQDQLNHLSAIVNYPGSYIIARYTNFAFLDVKNEGANPVDALTGYLNAINDEITRKRKEFDMPTGAPPATSSSETSN